MQMKNLWKWIQEKQLHIQYTMYSYVFFSFTHRWCWIVQCSIYSLILWFNYVFVCVDNYKVPKMDLNVCMVQSIIFIIHYQKQISNSIILSHSIFIPNFQEIWIQFNRMIHGLHDSNFMVDGRLCTVCCVCCVVFAYIILIFNLMMFRPEHFVCLLSVL